jgi:hypothetical protein
MIFCAKNEDGIPTWKLVLEGKKTVTRRLKPISIGKEFAIQPKRGKKAIARGKVIKCEPHTDFRDRNKWFFKEHYLLDVPDFDIEAYREGFKTWQGLLNWFKEHKIDINNTYRIEFEVLKQSRQEEDDE